AVLGRTFNEMASRIDAWHREMQEQLDARTRDLRHEQDRSRALVEALVEGVLLFGPDGRIRGSNAAAQRLFGLSGEELAGRTDAELGWQPLPDTDAGPAAITGRPVAAALAGGLPVRNVVMGVDSPAGRRMWILVNAQPLVAEEEIVAAVASLVDITDQREAMNAQERLSGELGRSNADLEQFSYAVSHDLQEPLRMVSSFVALLERRYDKLLDDEGREIIAFAVDGARRMQQMITDLLEYSRVHRRGDVFAEVDLGEVVEAALLNLSAAIADSGGTVSVASPLPRILGDRGQLVRLFQNLVGNALKFRAPDASPTIAVAAERRAEGWWLTVRDDGIGIPPSEIPRLFGVFQRLHPRDRYPGSGVGLALCRRIVERHGGRIEIASDGPGTGTTVAFLLPDAPAQAG
ncbi:MAG: sensor histidine kinase, partial [Actinomycetota bacterium]